MIWRAILVWLLAVCAAVADLPRHPSVACEAFAYIAANLPTTVNFQCHTNGNLTSDGLRAFQYDAENQLTNVYVAGQWQVGFIYDALNRRRVEQDFTWTGSAWSKTNETHFLYDGLVPIEEQTSSGTPLVTYTRGLDLSQSLTGAGGVGGLLSATLNFQSGAATTTNEFYHSDLNGNITTVMDAYQHVVARYEYDPFGKLLGQWGSYAISNRYLFSSKERVSPANLYYYGARFYDPNLGRWLNQDPLGAAGGVNLYGFVGNLPLNIVDPNGYSLFSKLGDALVSPISDIETGIAQFNGVVDQNVQLNANGYVNSQDLAINSPNFNQNLTAGNTDAVHAAGHFCSAGLGAYAGLLPSLLSGGLAAPEEAALAGLEDDALDGLEEAAEETAPNLMYHYTTADESLFANGLREGSSVTDKLYTDPLQASQELGIPVPNKVIPIQDVGQFVPAKPPIVESSFRFTGGGNDFNNPLRVPPSQLLPAQPIGPR